MRKSITKNGKRVKWINTYGKGYLQLKHKITGKIIKVLLDDNYCDQAKHFQWAILDEGYIGKYVKTREGKRAPYFLHQLVMEPRQGLVVNFKNGNKYDCRRSNLIYLPDQSKLDKKRCLGCDIEKQIVEFYYFKNGVSTYCRKCTNKITQKTKGKRKGYYKLYKNKWHFTNKKKALASVLKRSYGMSIPEYKKFLKDHDYKCDICGIDEKAAPKKKLSIDHDHKTGKVRGLLCNSHNMMLGLAGDSLKILKEAIKYLGKKKNEK